MDKGKIELPIQSWLGSLGGEAKAESLAVVAEVCSCYWNLKVER